MPFIFYDTETTGAEKEFDQILQFAAIKTDDDLNETDRFENRCRLLPYIIPAPKALLTNRINPELLADPQLPSHYEAIRRTREKLLAWSPAIYIGYNSIEFDENLLRQAFFKTLQPIYLTNTNGNARADVMRMAQAASIYAPNSITVPISDKGKSTFKLDRIAPANGFDHANAHEAMSDVEATIYVARLIKERIPDLWGTMLNTARKSEVHRFLEENLTVSFSDYNRGRSFTCLVTLAGVNPDYDARIGVFDLAYDPGPYLDMTSDQLIEALEGKPRVIRAVRANAQPMLMPAATSPKLPSMEGISENEIQRRAGLIRKNEQFRLNVGKALAGQYEDKKPSPDVEGRIYDGFPTNADERLMVKFHDAPDWGQRVEILNQIKDERYKLLGTRLIYSEQPSALPADVQKEMRRWVAERLLSDDPDAKWETIPMAIKEAEELKAEADQQQGLFLDQIKSFLNGLSNQLAQG